MYRHARCFGFRRILVPLMTAAAVAILSIGPIADATASGGGSGKTGTSGSGGGGGGATGGGGGGATGGGGGGQTLPLLISQTYTFDVGTAGVVSSTDGTDLICRTDGFLYESDGTDCVVDRFTTDAQGIRQLVFDGSVGQAWIDELNAWSTDPARRDQGGKVKLISTECLTTLFVLDPAAPGEAILNPACVGD